MSLTEKIFRKGTIYVCLLFITAKLYAQTSINDLPVYVKPPVTGNKAPLIFYITGDGGMKKFSIHAVETFHQKKFPVIALNALKYFWNKKTPQQAATDVANLIRYYQSLWNNNYGVVLIGYSLGADVLPFIYTKLPSDIKNKIRTLVLLSPSGTTDMEVHLSDLLGIHSTNGMSVLTEINKISEKSVLLVYGAEEKGLNYKQLTIHCQKLMLPGGHAYDEDASGVVNKILHTLQL